MILFLQQIHGWRLNIDALLQYNKFLILHYRSKKHNIYEFSWNNKIIVFQFKYLKAYLNQHKTDKMSNIHHRMPCPKDLCLTFWLWPKSRTFSCWRWMTASPRSPMQHVMFVLTRMFLVFMSLCAMAGLPLLPMISVWRCERPAAAECTRLSICS